MIFCEADLLRFEGVALVKSILARLFQLSGFQFGEGRAVLLKWVLCPYLILCAKGKRRRRTFSLDKRGRPEGEERGNGALVHGSIAVIFLFSPPLFKN